METVKVKDKNTGAIKEIKKSLAADYIGTGKFVLVDSKKEEQIKTRNNSFRKEE